MTVATDPDIRTDHLSATSREAMDRAVGELQARTKAWTQVSVRERISLIEELTRGFLAVADRWADASVKAEGIDPALPVSGEEALVGPYLVLRNLRLLKRALWDIEVHGRPRIPGSIRTRPDGQVTVRVFPYDVWDQIFYTGVTADVWMQPGVTAENLRETMAVAYHAPERNGAVALVLGAGNVTSIGPMDALYKLFVEDQVVLFKTHPANVYLGPLLEEGFKALVDRGFLRVVYGGGEEGAWLCAHPGVDEIHITGSDRTYEAIVYGSGEEGRRRKERDEPVTDKRVTAELGNVSPVIVVPGPEGSWSDTDIAYHAENLATMLANNAGFNCNAARVIIQHASSPQREPLMTALRQVLAQLPTRKAWYPGAGDRFDAFLEAHPEAEIFGDRLHEHLPWALIPGVSPESRDDIAFRTEAFCGVFSETRLQAGSAAEYLDRAVELCNETLWGTLNATLIVHPSSLRDPETKKALDRAVANLRYGTIAINHWAGAGYGLVITPWGAFPGHTRQDIQSGVGVAHNTLMFDRAQKAVVSAPFRAWPKPVWFITHKTTHKVTPKLVRFEAEPSFSKIPGILGLAMKG